MNRNKVEDFHQGMGGMDMLTEGLQNEESEYNPEAEMLAPALTSTFASFLQKAALQPFKKNDWYGYAGAERFDDGSEPLIGDLPVKNWPLGDPDGKPYDVVTIIVDKNGIGIIGGMNQRNEDVWFIKDALGSKEQDAAFAESLFRYPQSVESLRGAGFEVIGDLSSQANKPINASKTAAKAMPSKGSPDWHKLKIAVLTMRAPDAMVGVMGGPDKKQAEATLAEYGLVWDEAKNRPVKQPKSPRVGVNGEPVEEVEDRARARFGKKKKADFPTKGYGGDPMSDYGRDAADAPHSGAVCAECGNAVTEKEYSYGETDCCHAGVVPEEEYGQIDGFTASKASAFKGQTFSFKLGEVANDDAGKATIKQVRDIAKQLGGVSIVLHGRKPKDPNFFKQPGRDFHNTEVDLESGKRIALYAKALAADMKTKFPAIAQAVAQIFPEAKTNLDKFFAFQEDADKRQQELQDRIDRGEFGKQSAIQRHPEGNCVHGTPKGQNCGKCGDKVTDRHVEYADKNLYKKAAAHKFEHDAEIVVGQVLNGGFMQLWNNYGDRPGYHVKSMIMRTAQFFRDKGAEDIAQIFDKAARIPGKIEVRRDSWGNIDEESWQTEWDAKSDQFDPLEMEFYNKWESNYEGKPDVEDSWAKYFSPEAEKDSPIFRMMQQQNKQQTQASVKKAALLNAKVAYTPEETKDPSKMKWLPYRKEDGQLYWMDKSGVEHRYENAKKAGGLTYTDADLKALLRSFYELIRNYYDDLGGLSELEHPDAEIEDMMNQVLSDTPIPDPAASSYLDPERER